MQSRAALFVNPRPTTASTKEGAAPRVCGAKVMSKSNNSLPIIFRCSSSFAIHHQKIDRWDLLFGLLYALHLALF